MGGEAARLSDLSLALQYPVSEAMGPNRNPYHSAQQPNGFRVVIPVQDYVPLLKSKTVKISINDSVAPYPMTAVSFIQRAYLKASNAEEDDEFGYSVAISGDTALVGAYEEDGDGTDESNNSASGAGAAYLFERSGVT